MIGIPGCGRRTRVLPAALPSNGIVMNIPDTTAVPAAAPKSMIASDLTAAHWWLAFEQWLFHLSRSPATQLELARRAVDMNRHLTRFVQQSGRPGRSPCIAAPPKDHRFEHPGWQTWPFDVISQSYLLTQNWWQHATTGIRGVSRDHERVVATTVRDWLDIVAPDRFAWVDVPARQTGAADHHLLGGHRNRDAAGAPGRVHA
jgi:polyhydroxyalkanoate synthase subunit PhaC